MTDDFTSDIYTPEGLKWIQDTDMSRVLIRAFPDIQWLRRVLANTNNAFFPWPDPSKDIAGWRLGVLESVLSIYLCKHH